MKTGFNRDNMFLGFKASLLCVGLGLFVISPVQAAENSTVPSLAAPEVASNASDLAMSKNEKSSKGFEGIDAKTSASFKDVIKKFEGSSAVSLDDMNSLRQMIAKIDALIEAEKRLNELDKVRNEHDRDVGKSLASSIPLTAISPMPMPAAPAPTASVMPIAMPAALPPPPVESSELLRIIGSGGRYIAVVKSGSQTKRVQVGDHLDGSTISSITATSVEFDPSKVKPALYVKNVETVFGSAR